MVQHVLKNREGLKVGPRPSLSSAEGEVGSFGQVGVVVNDVAEVNIDSEASLNLCFLRMSARAVAGLEV